MKFIRACDFYPCPPDSGGQDRVVIFCIEQVMGGVKKTPFVTSHLDALAAVHNHPTQWSNTP